MFLGNRRGLYMFAEFLLFRLVFPQKHACVGLTVYNTEQFSSWQVNYSKPSLMGAVKIRRGVQSELHLCGERDA